MEKENTASTLFDTRLPKKAQKLAEELADSDNVAAYEAIYRNYTEDMIQKALTTVKGVPDDKIKKSRGALFTYLIKQYAQAP